jgi:hypothetical protein
MKRTGEDAAAISGRLAAGWQPVPPSSVEDSHNEGVHVTTTRALATALRALSHIWR